MKKNKWHILSYIIVIGLFTRAFWTLILRIPIKQLAEFSVNTKISWGFLLFDLILFLSVIHCLIKFIKVKKGIKLKNDNRSAKDFLITIIIQSIGLIFFMIITIVTQKALLRS